ncbi:hypothetical protein CK203_038596 [Vitis vinifera]|uniref:Uncharacterized protein n=1 Tax=Vitis vinifera TaxID=29760 RepID=A0A438I3W0_VITVI|nr:hypothetical protein CK203_038596 [Vitis vinifera]
MVDGFRWKPILRADQCGSAKEQPISGSILTSYHHYTYHYQFILLHLSPYRHNIHVRHPQVRGSWDSLYMLLFAYEGMVFLSSGVTPLMCRTDSVVFELPGSFMDPHGLARSSSLTGRSLRCGHDRYLIMIPLWSILGAIQLGPHLSVLRCHHASPSGRYVLDLWA